MRYDRVTAVVRCTTLLLLFKLAIRHVRQEQQLHKPRILRQLQQRELPHLLREDIWYATGCSCVVPLLLHSRQLRLRLIQAINYFTLSTLAADESFMPRKLHTIDTVCASRVVGAVSGSGSRSRSPKLSSDLLVCAYKRFSQFIFDCLRALCITYNI